MKKIFLSGLLALTLALPTQAIGPLKKVWVITQSDGTTVNVTPQGSGRIAFFTSEDGKIIVRGERDDFFYAVYKDGRLVPSPFIAHEANQRSAEELAFLAANDLANKTEILQEVFEDPRQKHAHKHGHVNKAIVASTQDGLGQYNKSGLGSVNSLGKHKIPVVMVQFNDLKFQSTTTIEKMNRYYNEVGYKDEANCVGSVRDYFKSQSRGMFDPEFEVVGIVTLDKSYKDYGGNDPVTGQDKGFFQFPVDVVEAATKQGISFEKFKNASGNVELLTLLYAGRGEATEGRAGADYLWPAQYDINKTMSGVHFNAFFVGNELYNDGKLMGMGVFTHEFGHALGLPDFYCTDYSYQNDNPFGLWSVMDVGPYVNDGNSPIGYTAYERSYLGWLNIRELSTTAEKITLHPAKYTDKEHAVLVRNPQDRREYFIFENRNPDTWYPNVDSNGNTYGQGLMVSHFTYEAGQWRQNKLNNIQKKKRAHIVTANNQILRQRVSKENLFGNGVSQIDSLKFYNDTYLVRPIYKITNNADGSVSFNYMEEDGVPVPYNVGDLIEENGNSLKYQGKKNWIVYAKENGAYTGDVNIPNTFVKNEKTYNVVGVGESAFANSPDLKTVTLPEGVTTIASNAFKNSAGIQAVNVSDKNAVYQSINGVLFTRSEAYGKENLSDVQTTTSFHFDANPWNLPLSDGSNANKGNLTKPITEEGVTIKFKNSDIPSRLYVSGTTITLRTYARNTMTFSVPTGAKIKSITFEAKTLNVTADNGTLADKVWTGDAQEVVFTSTKSSQISKIKVIYTGYGGAEAALLYYPAGRTGSYTLPSGVTRLGDYAFEGTALTSVNLPSSVVKVGANALSSASLKSIIAQPTTPPTATEDPFTETDANTCELIVADNTAVNAYKNATFWSKFGKVTLGITEVNSNPVIQDNNYYDLQGRRVTNPTRGVYIQNGKKVVIR